MNIVPINENIKLIPEEGDDTPEWNPQEYWRWTLVASRKGVMPPDPPSNSEVARLAALQSEHLWRIGFDRLARSSRGVAADCRDLLTNTTVDGAHSYACWVVSPDSLRSLISDLLDQSTTSRQLAMRALRWAENQLPHIHWLEKVFGSHITLAISNPTLESTLSTLRWKTENNIPIAIEVPANQTVRCKLERGLELDLSIFGPEISTQHTQTGTRSNFNTNTNAFTFGGESIFFVTGRSPTSQGNPTKRTTCNPLPTLESSRCTTRGSSICRTIPIHFSAN